MNFPKILADNLNSFKQKIQKSLKQSHLVVYDIQKILDIPSRSNCIFNIALYENLIGVNYH